MERTGVVVVVVALVVATAMGLAAAPAQRPVPSPGRTGARTGEGARPGAGGLGRDAGPDVTLLQFSTVFCGPCRTTRALCAEVARDRCPAYGIWRSTPSRTWRPCGRWTSGARRPCWSSTGRAIASRAAGAPTRAQLLGVVGAVLPAAAHAVRSLVEPRLTKRRTVDLCRVCASLCHAS